MKAPHAGAANGRVLTVPYHSLRNISSPEDVAANRKIFTGHLPAKSILGLPTNENVRNYLVEAEGKKRRAQTQVHKAIRETLKEHPDVFCVLNGGVVIVASSVEVDERQKILQLTKSSIINGSQTQGVLKDFFAETPDAPEISVKFELVVTDDEDLVCEISISRNYQNDVRSLSIVGRRGQLDELENSLQRHFPDLSLQKSETQWPTDDNNFVQTEKLLQVIAALLPDELWFRQGDVNKVYAYRSKASCLKDFEFIHSKANSPADDEQARYAGVYRFYLDIAPQALELYNKWKSNPEFRGCGLRCIERDGSEIVDVPDGLIFPILAALAEFAVKTNKGWRIIVPSLLDEGELVKAAKTAYLEIAKSKPEIMGKTKACYTAIQQITAIYKKFSKAA